MAKIGAALVATLMLIVSWRVVGRMASRFLRFWRALPLLGKVVLPVCLTVFYLHGSIKQTHGVINRIDKGEGEIYSVSSGYESIGNSVTGGINVLTLSAESLRISAFQVDQVNRAFGFEASWSENLFNNTLSRNLHLFSSTNLLEKHWLPLGEYLMPSGTNMHSFVVSEDDVFDSARSWFYGLFNQGAFFCFGIDVDSDSDGLTDSCEKLYAHTDPANPDTDGDSILDGVELDHGLNPNVSEASWSDYDGDGLTHSQELDFGSNPLMADSDGDGLNDGVEWRYGWNPNWPGETDEANVPGGMFTTFDRPFTVKLNFENPYPDEATVYGQGEGESFISLDDLVTRDQHKDTASTVTNNIISVETLGPKPVFTTNVTGVLTVKLRCDDYGVLKIGDLAVTNSWPNTDFAKAWKVIEANTVNEADVFWDSRGGSKWNFEYECYFYPEMPHLAITNNCWIGLDRTGDPNDPYVSSKILAQAFISPTNENSESAVWRYSGICDQKEEGLYSLELWTTNRENASAAYRDQIIRATSSDGIGAASDFTVVKVDVTIGDVVDEKDEADMGAFVFYSMDSTNSVMSTCWTNSLVDVVFSCEPSNLPTNEMVLVANIGSGELYEQLPDKSLVLVESAYYPACEISNRIFKVHGHQASSAFAEDNISIEHITSGAKDIAPYTILDVKLIPDYDRNGAIDDFDYQTVASGSVFRFWINDDEDEDSTEGKYAESQEVDIPGAGDDWSDDKVNGYRDLIDFTPVCLDVFAIAKLPLAIRDNLVFKIRHNGEAVNVVWSGIERMSVGTFQTGRVDCCGVQLNENSYNSTAEAVGAGGVLVPELLAEKMKGSPLINNAVVFIEGRQNSQSPLALDVYFGTKKIAEGNLDMQLSSVEEMYRCLNVRDFSLSDIDKTSKLASPKNRPDSETSNRHLFFLHGATFSQDEARGWSSEIFKRLWQCGMTAKFTSVIWRGDIGSDANYQENVSNAFVTASVLASEIEKINGEKVLMAHSLGNMVCSAMIQDYGLEVSKYLMCNSAVPAEAYDTSLALRVPQLVHPDWEEYPTNSWTASWHTLFKDEPNDDRKHLGWPGRFANVLSKAVNFYSAGENGGDEVLELAADNDVGILTGVTSSFAHHAWHKQELFKGRGIGVGAGATDWSGWNIEENWLGVNKISVEEALSMNNADFKTNTVFYCYPSSMNSTNIPLLVRGAHLALGIPSLTAATGATDLSATLDQENSFNLDLTSSDIEHPNGWPSKTSYPNRWLHSDIKDVSFFFNFKFYEKVIEKGGLK